MSRRRALRATLFALGFAAGAVLPARTQDATARDTLARAEGWCTGSTGRIDEAQAKALFEAAAATGEAVARMRVATLRHRGGCGFAKDRAAARREATSAAPEVTAAAARGDLEATFLAGSQALFGLGRARSDADAAVWYEKAAARGHPWASHNLAWMLENGRGREKDVARAEELYRRAAEAGIAASAYDLGRLFVWGEQQRAGEGLDWLARAAARGHVGAQRQLGSALFYGQREVRPDYARAIPLLQGAAASGSIDAQLDLGYAYLVGLGVVAERATALSWFERAARLGSELGMLETAWILLVDARGPDQIAAGWSWLAQAEARGTEGFRYLIGNRNDDPREVAVLDADLARVEAAARTGSSTAQALLAMHYYLRGTGEPELRPVALRWARAGAAAGEPLALRVLGLAYHYGVGVDRDPEEELRWEKRGAELGDTYCQWRYAQLLRDGKAVPRDLAESVRWYLRSAEAGNLYAMVIVADLYDQGWDGRPIDRSQALPWRKKAAALGDTASIGWLRVHYPDEAP